MCASNQFTHILGIRAWGGTCLPPSMSGPAGQRSPQVPAGHCGVGTGSASTLGSGHTADTSTWSVPTKVVPFFAPIFSSWGAGSYHKAFSSQLPVCYSHTNTDIHSDPHSHMLTLSNTHIHTDNYIHRLHTRHSHMHLHTVGFASQLPSSSYAVLGKATSLSLSYLTLRLGIMTLNNTYLMGLS